MNRTSLEHVSKAIEPLANRFINVLDVSDLVSSLSIGFCLFRSDIYETVSILVSTKNIELFGLASHYI